MMQSKRVEYIDRAKGVAILLMLLGHSAPGEIVNTWIFAFHMPLFFIVSGILMREKHQSIVPFYEVEKSFKKRLFQLGVPYIVFSLLLTLFYGSLNYFSYGHWSISSYILNIVTLQGVDSLWFIPCYFVAENVMKLTCMRSSVFVNIIGVSSILLIIAFFLSEHISSFGMLRLGLKFVICYSFVYIGYVLCGLSLLRRFNGTIAIIVFCVCSILALYNGFSEIGSLRLNNPILYYMNAMGITWALFFFLNVSKDTVVMKSLSFFGRNSIIILCTNNLIIEVLRLLDYRMCNNVLLSWGVGGAIILTAIIIVIEIALIKLVNSTNVKFVFGKRK